jgi:DNA excision repair protein ERCC-5
LQRDAYYHPTVDSSQEPFKWGLPDLDALRAFLKAELGWGQAKVDDLLLPIIQKASKRGQAAALNRQGNLNEFFDVTSGSGTAAPRKRQAYASKRLQQIVSDFRKQQKDNGAVPDRESASPSPEVEEETPKPTRKRKSSKKDPRGEDQREVAVGAGAGGGVMVVGEQQQNKMETLMRMRTMVIVL